MHPRTDWDSLSARFNIDQNEAGSGELTVCRAGTVQPSSAAMSEALPPAAVVSMQVTRSVAKRAT